MNKKHRRGKQYGNPPERNSTFFQKLQLYIGLEKERMVRFRSGIWFVVSALGLALEVTLLNRFGIAREKEMYLFLAPVSVCLFLLAAEIRLPDHPIYKTLRNMSSLIIFVHLWVDFAAGLVLGKLPTFPDFCLVLLLSMGFSWLILVLSGKEQFRFLKKLYS